MVMKTMKIQEKLNNLFLALILCLVSANVMAETKWEVASIFLGSQEDQEFQKDIDQNILEISTLNPSSILNLSIYREMPEKTYSYFPAAKPESKSSLGDLLSGNSLKEYKIPGKYSLSQRQKLKDVLKKAFQDPQAKKMLVIYGHGDGPLGLKDMRVTELHTLLNELKIKLDIIWFDACFLSNIEFLYQLRNFSSYMIASEEAEFSSGLPFGSLEDLPQFSNSKDAAIMLAKAFIDSYSYVKNGKQKMSVTSSSATISVIDNAEVKNFAQQLVKVLPIIEKLPAKDKESLKARLTRHFSMDNIELIDLGSLLIEVRAFNKDAIADQELTKLIRLLNIESVKKLKTNPRLKISIPAPGAQMVFGFNNWENGFESEYKENDFFSEILKTTKFINGPQQQSWPVKSYNSQSTLLAPFAPQVDSFHYYFIDSTGKRVLTPVNSFVRTFDIVEDSLEVKKEGSLLVYTAYTQRVGKKAERYTGLSITHFNAAASMDYFELEFNQLTKWLNL
jgi:Clostripain family